MHCSFVVGFFFGLLVQPTLAKRLAMKTDLISFASKGFPYKDQIFELFILVTYCKHVTFSTFSLISIF